MKIILIIILIYFALLLAGRYVFPFLIRGYVKHYSKKFYDEMEADRKESSRKEGEIKITRKPADGRKQSADSGDYVEYEEIN